MQKFALPHASPARARRVGFFRRTAIARFSRSGLLSPRKKNLMDSAAMRGTSSWSLMPRFFFFLKTKAQPFCGPIFYCHVEKRAGPVSIG